MLHAGCSWQVCCELPGWGGLQQGAAQAHPSSVQTTQNEGQRDRVPSGQGRAPEPALLGAGSTQRQLRVKPHAVDRHGMCGRAQRGALPALGHLGAWARPLLGSTLRSRWRMVGVCVCSCSMPCHSPRLVSPHIMQRCALDPSLDTTSWLRRGELCSACQPCASYMLETGCHSQRWPAAAACCAPAVQHHIEQGMPSCCGVWPSNAPACCMACCLQPAKQTSYCSPSACHHAKAPRAAPKESSCTCTLYTGSSAGRQQLPADAAHYYEQQLGSRSRTQG